MRTKSFAAGSLRKSFAAFGKKNRACEKFSGWSKATIFTLSQTLLAKVILPRRSSRGNLNLSDRSRIDPEKLLNIASRLAKIRGGSICCFTERGKWRPMFRRRERVL